MRTKLQDVSRVLEWLYQYRAFCTLRNINTLIAFIGMVKSAMKEPQDNFSFALFFTLGMLFTFQSQQWERDEVEESGFEDQYHFQLLCEAARKQDLQLLKNAQKLAGIHLPLRQSNSRVFLTPVAALARDVKAREFLLAHGARLFEAVLALVRENYLEDAHTLLLEKNLQEGALVEILKKINHEIFIHGTLLQMVRHLSLLFRSYPRAISRQIMSPFLPMAYLLMTPLSQLYLRLDEKQQEHYKSSLVLLRELHIEQGCDVLNDVYLRLAPCKTTTDIVLQHGIHARVTPLFLFLDKIATEYPDEYYCGLSRAAYSLTYAGLTGAELARVITAVETHFPKKIIQVYESILRAYTNATRHQKRERFLIEMKAKDEILWRALLPEKSRPAFLAPRVLYETTLDSLERKAFHMLVDAIKSQNSVTLAKLLEVVCIHAVNYVMKEGRPVLQTVVSQLGNDEKAMDFLIDHGGKIQDVAGWYAGHGQLEKAYALLEDKRCSLNKIPLVLSSIARKLAKKNNLQDLDACMRFVETHYPYYKASVIVALFNVLEPREGSTLYESYMAELKVTMPHLVSSAEACYLENQAYQGKVIIPDGDFKSNKMCAIILGFGLSHRVDAVFLYLQHVKKYFPHIYLSALNEAGYSFAYAHVDPSQIARLTDDAHFTSEEAIVNFAAFVIEGYFNSGRKSVLIGYWHELNKAFPHLMPDVYLKLMLREKFSADVALQQILKNAIVSQDPVTPGIGLSLHDHAISQGRIRDQLILFMQTQGFSPALIQEYLHSLGECAGYAPLVIYSVWLTFQPVRYDENQQPIPRDDYPWLSNVLYEISQWKKGCDQSNMSQIDFMRMSVFIRDFQVNYHEIELHLTDTRDRRLSIEWNETVPFTKQELKTKLPELLAPERMILLYCNSHAHGLIQIQGHLYFTEANDTRLLRRLDDVDKVVDQIYATNEMDDGFHHNVTIRNYCFNSPSVPEFKYPEAKAWCADLSIFKSKNILVASSKNLAQATILDMSVSRGSVATVAVLLDLAKEHQGGLNLKSEPFVHAMKTASTHKDARLLSLFKAAGVVERPALSKAVSENSKSLS